MEKSEAQAELSKIYRLKQELDKEMPSVISTGDTTKALGLKAEIERRINAVQELLTPPGSFTKEQREALENKGFVIYRLTGQSIASKRDRGYRFESTWHKNFPDFENKTSRLTEVAFNPNPDMFFLPGSNDKTLSQQEEMVDQYSKELQQEIKGVKAVIGEVPDYVELAFGYTGKYGPLFEEAYNFMLTRTITRVGINVAVGTNVAVVGSIPGDGLRVMFWDANEGSVGLGVAPLVVPENS